MSFSSLKEWAEAQLAPHACAMLAAFEHPLTDDTYGAVEPVLGGAATIREAVLAYPTDIGKDNMLMIDLNGQAQREPNRSFTIKQNRAVANCLRHALRGGTGTFPNHKAADGDTTASAGASSGSTPAKHWDKATRTYRCFTCGVSISGYEALYEHREKEHGIARKGATTGATTTATPSASVLPSFTPKLNLDLRVLPDGRFALEPDGKNGLASPWFVIKRTTKRPYQRNGRFLWGRGRGRWEYVEKGRIEVRVQRGDTKELIGEQKLGETIYYGEQEELLALVLADPAKAMTTYGRLLGVCSYCGRSLTDDLSRLRGIGPDCWEQKHIPFSRSLAAKAGRP